MVKGFFDFFNCPGRKSGYLWWAAAVPEKLTSVVIITAPLTEAAKKRGSLRVFLIGASAQGRRFGSAGALGWAAPVPRAKPDPKLQQCGKFHSGAAGGATARKQGRSREAPALFQLVPTFCKPHFFQVCYVPAGLLSRNCCKVCAGFHV